jgi:Undecaprenyl-phosphate glucose phosphotransferase
MAVQRYRQSLITTLAPLIDGVLVGCSGWLAYYTRWENRELTLSYVSVLILGTGLALILLPASGAYNSWRSNIHWRDMGKTLPGLFAAAALMAILGTLTKTNAEFSRLWMAYWLLYSFLSLFLFRWLTVATANLLQTGHTQAIRILIVGDGEFAQSVAQKAMEARDANWEIAGFVSTSGSAPDRSSSAFALADIDRLDTLVTDPGADIDEVWIALDNTEVDRQEAVVRVLQTCCLRVRYVPDLSMLALLNHMPAQVAGMTLIELNASPLTGPNILVKATIDKLISLAALILLAPLLALIALIIKLGSPGPVFFVQDRHGWDGKVIKVLKFRTMHHEQAMLRHAPQAQLNDPRVTTAGRFLRKFSLDELPQLMNVLRGDMSIVGPRPHPVALNESYVSRINAYMQRHTVKPGITGWAQIHGFRGETETLEKMARRVEYDLYYIEHWSLWLDLRIIALTLVKGWTGNNAY